MLAELVAFQAPEGIKASPELPRRLRIVPWGKSPTNDGDVVCNETTAAVLPQNQLSRHFDRVALDFQHNSVEGTKFYRGEPVKVAAYATPEVVPGEGIFLKDIDWTDIGKEMAAGGHYPDISPAIVKDKKTGIVHFVHSAALCRQGEIEGLSLHSAAAALLSTFSAEKTKQGKSTMDYKAQLLGVLGLPDTASDDDIAARIKVLGTDSDNKDSETPKDKPAESVKTLSARVSDLTKQIQTFAASNEKSQRDDLVARATREGKVIPLSAEHLASLPVTTLSAMVEKLPVTVPVERRTVEGVEVHGASAIPVSTERKKIQENLGLSDEDMKKFDK